MSKTKNDEPYIGQFLSDKGATLVELLVAIALLLGVLLPAGMFLGFIAHYPQNKNKVLALGKAQTAMEELLYKKRANKKEIIDKQHSGWLIKEKVRTESNTIYYRIIVYRHNEEIVSLSTVRFKND